ncbi:head maturation protease, ClpP-related [Mesorhizobium sp.]|uniref:head maturation protease, ClpP-related n=1 Tax=Mesorhizobium sp. TaxID=1871066 RepID=UPI000FE2A345|nr:head maturation protease, ClpP-related [Mesorhizobium sp.]RWQ16101.1 MAG: Clp protease ClpP [Mesorhizobium sp.]
MKKIGGAKASSGYRVVARGADRAEIYVYGPIGMSFWDDGVSAAQFQKDLKALGSAIKTIDLRINSEGGDVMDARAMYTLLVQHQAKVIAHIDGLAASAASFLAMAGDEIEISEGGFFMIHNSRMTARGGADDFRRAADLLDQVDVTICDTYCARSKKDPGKVKKWMDDETWFTGKEAVEHGFADKMVENLQVAASVRDATGFKNIPTQLLPRRAAALAKIAALAR